MPPRGVGAFVTLDRVAEVVEGIKVLAEREVLIGVPEEKTDRRGDEGRAITNAALAAIHSKGEPTVGIPARPFLEPGVERAQAAIVEELKATGRDALDGKGAAAVERGLARAGQIAVTSARNVIREGIPPPLAEATVRRRRIRSPGSSYRRKAKDPVPLLDTTQLLRSITRVVSKIRRAK
jgi:hypothetical protein